MFNKRRVKLKCSNIFLRNKISGQGYIVLFQLDDNENVNSNSLEPDQPPPPGSPTDKTDSDDLTSDTMPPGLHRNKTSVSPSLQRILDGESEAR